MTRFSRRTLLRGLVGGATGPLLLRAAPPVAVLPVAAACAANGDTVQIAVVWSGRELEMFRRVLDTWPDRPQIQLISVGNGIESLLKSRIEAGNPPDIAVLPQPGMLDGLKVIPLDKGLARWPDEPWQNLLSDNDGNPCGVWLKATHKSVFWHRLSGVPSDPFRKGYQPETVKTLWTDLAALKGTRGLGIGAADGWVLTDWFENALLAMSPPVYDCLAKGGNLWKSDPVGSALRWLADVWRIEEVLPGGPQRALLTQYDEAAIRVLGGRPGRAGLTFEGDFIAPALAPYQKAELVDPSLGTFRFPPLNSEERPPLVVGGDFAVLLNERTTAQGVLTWLASECAAHQFAKRGFLTLHRAAADADYLKSVPGRMHPDSNLPDLFKDLANQLRDAADPEVKFDLSDQLKGGLAGGDGQGIWRLLQKFFAEVTRPDANVTMVVECTQQALVRAAEKAPNR